MSRITQKTVSFNLTEHCITFNTKNIVIKRGSRRVAWFPMRSSYWLKIKDNQIIISKSKLNLSKYFNRKIDFGLRV